MSPLLVVHVELGFSTFVSAGDSICLLFDDLCRFLFSCLIDEFQIRHVLGIAGGHFGL